jgi:hypothetical protein
MDRDDNGVALRRAVAERLRKFFTDWTAQLAAGTAQIWDGVQRRVSESPPDAPPARHMQRQRQQSEIEPERKE